MAFFVLIGLPTALTAATAVLLQIVTFFLFCPFDLESIWNPWKIDSVRIWRIVVIPMPCRADPASCFFSGPLCRIRMMAGNVRHSEVTAERMRVRRLQSVAILLRNEILSVKIARRYVERQFSSYPRSERRSDDLGDTKLDRCRHTDASQSNPLRSLSRLIFQNILIQLGLATDIVCLHEQLVKVSKEIEEEALTPKMATKVFVTFEKEASQRECLEQMTTGERNVARDSPPWRRWGMPASSASPTAISSTVPDGCVSCRHRLPLPPPFSCPSL